MEPLKDVAEVFYLFGPIANAQSLRQRSHVELSAFRNVFVSLDLERLVIHGYVAGVPDIAFTVGEVANRFTDGSQWALPILWRIKELLLWPRNDMPRSVCNQNKSLPLLRHSICRGVENSVFNGTIADILQCIGYARYK